MSGSRHLRATIGACRTGSARPIRGWLGSWSGSRSRSIASDEPVATGPGRARRPDRSSCVSVDDRGEGRADVFGVKTAALFAASDRPVPNVAVPPAARHVPRAARRARGRAHGPASSPRTSCSARSFTRAAARGAGLSRRARACSRRRCWRACRRRARISTALARPRRASSERPGSCGSPARVRARRRRAPTRARVPARERRRRAEGRSRGSRASARAWRALERGGRPVEVALVARLLRPAAPGCATSARSRATRRVGFFQAGRRRRTSLGA